MNEIIKILQELNLEPEIYEKVIDLISKKLEPTLGWSWRDRGLEASYNGPPCESQFVTGAEVTLVT